MEKKIQVTTADIQAKAEVIVLNSYFIAKVVRAHDCIDTIIDNVKSPRTKYNKETGKREPELDENGNQLYDYCCCGDEMQRVEERVYPLLKELINALGIEQLTV